jgi:hypothetical protein
MQFASSGGFLCVLTASLVISSILFTPELLEQADGAAEGMVCV